MATGQSEGTSVEAPAPLAKLSSNDALMPMTSSPAPVPAQR